jgi:hypothetical protein
MNGALHGNRSGRRAPACAPRWLPVLAAAALLGVPGIARAQALAELPTPPTHAPADPGVKSPGTALALSALTTAAGAGLLIASRVSGADDYLPYAGAVLVFAGPNLGHAYAGDHNSAVTQLGVRTGAGVVVVTGAIWAFLDCGLTYESCDQSRGPRIVQGAGLVLGAASIIYSIYDAPRAAGRANARIRAQRLLFAPAPITGPAGTNSVGLHLTGRF